MPREGSLWRKWDLHIHAPTSVLNNQFAGTDDADKWEQYLSTIEGLGPYGALGITDYYSVDGFKKVREYRAHGRLANVEFLLPNVELRIVPVTESAKAINIHLLIAPEIVDDLDDLLFSHLSFRCRDNTYSATRSGLVGLGRAHTGNAALAEAGAYREGVGQFKLDIGQLRACLERSARLRDKCLVAVANGTNDGNSGIQESGLKALREDIYRLADCVFSGRPADRAYFLGLGTDPVDVVQTKYGRRKPCIHGCDAHSLEKLGAPDLARITWIKADTTFEGLRQICHEPETRVFIGEFPPPTPLHRMGEVSISLPVDTRVGYGDADYAFCFRGDHSLAFAAGLTCVIGGRGAGKSTLLNLVHQYFAPGQSEALADRQFSRGGEAFDVNAHVSVTFQGDQQRLEFISQNAVEEFALDFARLTKAIHTRLLSQDDDAALSTLEAEGQRGVEALQHSAALQRRLIEGQSSLATTRASREALKLLVASVADPEYQRLAGELNRLSTNAASLRQGRERLVAAVAAIRSAVAPFSRSLTDGGESDAAEQSSERNLYETALDGLIVQIRALLRGVEVQLDPSTASTEERALDDELGLVKAGIESFLRGRGLSPENLADITNASAKIPLFDTEVSRLEGDIAAIQEGIAAATADLSVRERFEDLISRRLEVFNQAFREIPGDVRRIALRYRRDEPAMEDALVDYLLTELGKEFSGARYRTDHVRQELDRAGPLLTTSAADLVSALRNSPNKTAQALDAYFSQPANVTLWTTKRDQLFCDLTGFMRLDILYDGRPLDQSSFGQRCSAVLVVLLSLGNSPIVIDEPEAHLDSAIIANYLVELVKRVKQQRQVIFATHNANFVVNGDAELIHVVAMDDENISKVQSITIEDLDARPLLLALEGGEAAFLQREGRYRLGGVS